MTVTRYRPVKWVTFTEQINDPKLAWLERRLGAAGIPCRRNGYSFDGPILEVPEDRLEEAFNILSLVAGVSDDDPRFQEVDTEDGEFDENESARKAVVANLISERSRLAAMILRVERGPLRDQLVDMVADINMALGDDGDDDDDDRDDDDGSDRSWN